MIGYVQGVKAFATAAAACKLWLECNFSLLLWFSFCSILCVCSELRVNLQDKEQPSTYWCFSSYSQGI